jgi:hypothetical protein
VDASAAALASSDAFVASWDGVNILTISGGTGTGYQFYSFTETATTTSTVLQFGGNAAAASYFVDDAFVGAAPVPEPSSILFAVAGLVGIWLTSRRYAKPVDLHKELAATV